jgi:alkyl sulfatase BDS1-like metallo-beta-lactamase superfamily hydrolase
MVLHLTDKASLKAVATTAAAAAAFAFPLAAVFAYCQLCPSEQVVAKALPACGCQSDLANHSKIFQKQILHIDETNVYVAIGYSLANCIIVEGSTSLVIIDTTESVSSAKEIISDFYLQYSDKVKKPVKGIIYTHFHHDHVGGTESFLRYNDGNEQFEQAPGKVEIWAHHTTGGRISQFNSVMGPIAYERASKMYGTYLPEVVNCGIGPKLRLDTTAGEKVGFHNLPTHTYSGEGRSIRIDDIELQLIHAPGETDDQTVVFYPKYQLLFAADNFYESFPNLYTIRGAPNRDVLQWCRSLDVMMSTRPTIMVPSHTLPVYGHDEIRRRLTDYRDAIQFVHDQTVQRMLRGQHPNAIAAELTLPEPLRDREYLKEYYGTVGWSAKSVYDSYLGWYSGDECDLNPLPPVEQSKRIIDLAGGADTVLRKAQSAFDAQDYQWALELSTAVIRTQGCLGHTRSVVSMASSIKVEACCALASQQVSANGRNWYLTAAMMTKESFQVKVPPAVRTQFFQASPFSQIFQGMCLRLNAAKVSGRGTAWSVKSMRYVIYRDDDPSTVQESWTLFVRNCVLYAAQGYGDDDERDSIGEVDIVLEATESSLRTMFVNPRSVATKIVGLPTSFSSSSSSETEESSKLVLTKGRWMDVASFFRMIERDL